MKFPLRPLILLQILVSLMIISACQPVTEHKNTNKLQVTTTTGLIADIVENVGGDAVQVTALMGPGVDPHLYKASQKDIKKLDEADLILYNGLYLEGKMIEVFENISKHKPAIAVTDQIPVSQLIQTGDGQYDPHIWFDVKLWMQATERVKEALIQVDSKNKVVYEKQAQEYLSQLNELDQYVKRQLNQIPTQHRVLVTAHDAFGYFGRAYDVEVVGLQGMSTASEYGLKDVQRIVEIITERKIKAVFLESSVPKRSIEAVVQGAREKNHSVQIGGELYSDALGEEGSAAGTYIGMVRHNVDTIVKALK